MKADYEIQNWGAEIVKSRDDGGVGILVRNFYFSIYITSFLIFSKKVATGRKANFKSIRQFIKLKRFIFRFVVL